MIVEGRQSKLLLSWACAVALLTLSGCASRPSRGALKPVSPPPEGSAVHTVLVATNRAPSDDPGTFFEEKRSASTHFARFDIAVPEKHEKGELEVTRRNRSLSEKQFVAVSSDILPGEDVFLSELQNHVAANESKTLMIFVHGFNTLFAEGVFYVAQLKHDVEFEGTAVLFSWPSGGQWTDYVYDRESVMTARDALETTIRLASESGAERIGIIAHSMGCYLTMEALRQAAIAGDPTFGGKLNTVILAAPDVAVDVFKSQMRRIGTQPNIAVQHSENDKYLNVAKWLTGHAERVGNFSGDPELAELGVVTFDTTKLKASETHYKFAAKPDVLRQIFEGMEANRGMKTGSSRKPVTQTMIGEAGEVIVKAPARLFGNFFGARSARRN